MHVWPSTTKWVDREESYLYETYIDGDRCGCKERIAYQWQCCHELCSDGGLILDKWHPR